MSSGTTPALNHTLQIHFNASLTSLFKEPRYLVSYMLTILLPIAHPSELGFEDMEARELGRLNVEL